jgi:hypothetical protein
VYLQKTGYKKLVFFILAVFVKFVVLVYNPWISAAGTCFPRGGPGASSALKSACGVSSDLFIPQESVPSATIHSGLFFKVDLIKIHLVSYLAVDWSERRRLLREIAVCGDPAGAAEEAPQSPRGKRSLSWKSTAGSTTNTKLS